MSDEYVKIVYSDIPVKDGVFKHLIIDYEDDVLEKTP